mmetsp:Transcript_21109/g.63165  ORF Transcript_21109/g.63165 Transcript_21109/m.63165 type:complete len:227 (-) Transcript_21109:2295-2975(-)
MASCTAVMTSIGRSRQAAIADCTSPCACSSPSRAVSMSAMSHPHARSGSRYSSSTSGVSRSSWYHDRRCATSPISVRSSGRRMARPKPERASSRDSAGPIWTMRLGCRSATPTTSGHESPATASAFRPASMPWLLTPTPPAPPPDNPAPEKPASVPVAALGPPGALGDTAAGTDSVRRWRGRKPGMLTPETCSGGNGGVPRPLLVAAPASGGKPLSMSKHRLKADA